MSRRWSVADFVLIWIAGFLLATVFFTVGLLVTDDEWLLILSLAGQFVGIFGMLWLLSRRREKGALGFSISPRDVVYVGLGSITNIGLLILIQPLAQRVLPDDRPPQELVEILADAQASRPLRLSLMVTAVLLAPLAEELMYRGVLLRALRERGKQLAIFVTAAVFAAFHIVGLDTERLLPSAAVVLPPFFVLGLLLAWVTLRTGRLGPAIFIHSGYNLLTVLILLIPQELLERPLTALANPALRLGLL